MKQVIAIDGPSGAGKTTIAKFVANELGYNYLDTGALYRAIAFALRNNGIEAEGSDDVLREILEKTSVAFNSKGRVLLNGRDVSAEIRTKEMDHYSSVFSARRVVRDFLLEAQRSAALQDNLVVEGRDTTTVVFPGAEKKIFLDASLEERARRRYLQYKGQGIQISMDDARSKIAERDRRDAGRDIAPLRVAPDALSIDSSDLSIEQVIQKILDYVRNGN
jgi:cytidylate kinase